MSDNIETVPAIAPEAPKVAPVPALKVPEPFLNENAVYRLKAKTSIGGTHHRIKIVDETTVEVLCLLNEYSAPVRMTAAEFEAQYAKV